MKRKRLMEINAGYLNVSKHSDSEGILCVHVLLMSFSTLTNGVCLYMRT